MKTLIVEDDFVSRKMMHLLLSPYGECDIAVDGKEAIEAFELAAREGKRYDLICLDIMMPGMDGHTVLKTIRGMEEVDQVFGSEQVKIIMTTALKDSKNVLQAFNAQCEAYLVKPIRKQELLQQIRSLGLM